jgi:hypothetical protein
MEDDRDDVKGGEGPGSERARKGGDRGDGSRDERERQALAKAADDTLRARKQSDGGGARGRRAARSRNAGGRMGGRDTGRRASGTEAGTRRGLQSTVNQLRRRSGAAPSVPVTAGGTGRSKTVGRVGSRGANRTTLRSARGSRPTTSAVRTPRAGQRTRSKARKAGKNRKR